MLVDPSQTLWTLDPSSCADSDPRRSSGFSALSPLVCIWASAEVTGHLVLLSIFSMGFWLSCFTASCIFVRGSGKIEKLP